MANINFLGPSIHIFSLITKIKKGMPDDDDDDRPFGGDIQKYLSEVNNRLYFLMGNPHMDGTYEIPLSFRDYPTEVSYRHPFRKQINDPSNRRQLEQSGQRGMPSKMDTNQKPESKKIFVSSFTTLDQATEQPKTSAIRPNTRKDTAAEVLSSKGKLLPPNIGDYKKDTGADQRTKQESIVPSKDVKKNLNSALKKVDTPQTLPQNNSQSQNQNQSQSQSQKKDAVKKKEEITSAQKKDHNNKKPKP